LTFDIELTSQPIRQNQISAGCRHFVEPSTAGHEMNLGEADYLKQRLTPQPGELLYLHLSDLLIALKGVIPKNPSMVLDYGCGGSPYRPLFGSCTYHRADLAGGSNLDFEYGPDAKLPPELSGYDCVLSSQVLEHVEDPEAYLAECYRVMRPGGCLILTTHGLYEDHACPYDYWRWTIYGLKRIVENTGLKVEVARKLTTGPRSAVFFAEGEFHRLRFGAAGFYGKLLSLGVRTVKRLGSRRLHEMCDISFAANRVVDIQEPGHNTYVAIAILAYRRK
jgi:SAM-dependent methyltransferase